MVEVRLASIADAREIARIHVETWRVAYRGLLPDAVLDGLSEEKRAAFWRGHLEKTPGRVFVAEANGSLAGFCDLGPTRDRDATPEAVAEIVAIYVLPGLWRKGAGRALCNNAIAEARRGGFRKLTLWTLASNAAAKRFYEAMGFQLDGAEKIEHMADGTELREVRFRQGI